MKRRLPIGIQDFVSIREGGFVYVDKTARIHDLVTGSGKMFFLSRPRRFGKSLLCSTLAALFQGRRELFRGLAVDRLDWDWKARPVLHFDLNPGNYREGEETLKAMLQNNVETAAAGLGISPRGGILPEKLMNLIIDARKQQGERAVILIDEYDKPLLSALDDRELHYRLRNILKGFYGVLKSADQHLDFVLLTGVTKFSQVSVFSELNNLVDLSLDENFFDICGITQDELERDFDPEIREIVLRENFERREYLSDIQRFYNGYRFSSAEKTVYNPFGLLNHFEKNGQFDTYWFATGTPEFLITLLENQKIDILNLEGKTVTLDDFQRFDAENLEAVPVLYQSGYLTITGRREGVFTLDFPNEEVRSAFAKSLLEHYLSKSPGGMKPSAASISSSLIRGDAEGAMEILKSFFRSIPYDLRLKNEKYYQTIIHLVFRMLGLYCLSEIRTANGRIDSLVETKEYVYCFEFKLKGTAREALEQINRKDYLLPWQFSEKKLFKIGVAFDYEQRGIANWLIETAEGK